MKRRHLYSTIALGLSLVAVGTWAAAPPSWSIPNIFHANTAASAAEVNANFDAVHNQVLYLKQQLEATQTRLATVENSKVMALEGNLDLLDVAEPSDSSKTYPTVRFSGVNLQIVNGTGTTNGPTDGLGNLIIGYNAPFSAGQTEFCSSGAYDNQLDCTNHGKVWAENQHSGSHNLVLGGGNAYTQDSGIVAGRNNIINRQQASVLGGFGNIASGTRSVVSGGHSNEVIGDYASVSGGSENVASGDYSSVSGGDKNKAIGDFASVSGGVSNKASGDNSSVSGGNVNDAVESQSWVGGGRNNKATGMLSSVSGGYNNNATGNSSSISGGSSNTAHGQFGSVSGGSGSNAYGKWSSVSGGDTNQAMGEYSSISGGYLGTAQAEKSSISGGYGGWVTGKKASVSGGANITASTEDEWCGGKDGSTWNCH